MKSISGYGAGISSYDAARLSGVSTRQLHHWDTRRVVSPTMEPAAGSGSRRRYQPVDLLLLVVAMELRDQSVGLETIGKVVRAIRQAKVGLDCDEGLRLVWSRDKVASLTAEPETIQQAVLAASTSLVIHLGKLAADVLVMLSKHEPAQTRDIEVGGRSYRVVITQSEHGVTVRTAGRRAQSVTAETDNEAIEMLARVLGAGTQAKSVDVARSTGAATWGADW